MRTIIFDWGGVCTYGHFLKNFAKSLSERCGLEAETIESTFRELEYPYETGKISPEQFWNKFKNRLSLNMKIEDIRQVFLKSDTPNQKILDFILELKSKYKIVLLTNNYEDVFSYIKRDCVLDKYFDHTFSSSEIKHKKPEKEAFEYVINKLRVNPEETVFVDNSEKNVVGAKKLDFKTILFKDLASFKKELSKIDSLK